MPLEAVADGVATVPDSSAMIATSRVAAAGTLLGTGLVGILLLATPALAANGSVAATFDLFSPTTITIHVDDTVTWTNRDTTFDHDVTFASFGSGTLKPKKSYTHRFETVGTFGYRCTIHGNTARVVVTLPTTPQPTRRPTPKPTPRPTPSPSPSLSPSASPSPSASASPTTSATQTSTPTTSSAIALSSTSTASAPADNATPVADPNRPTIVLILVVALATAGAIALGSLVVRRR